MDKLGVICEQKSFNNIRFLFNTNQQYLLIITKIDRNISSLIDINNNTKIGIDYIGSSDYKVTNQLLNSFKKKKDIDYNLYYFQNRVFNASLICLKNKKNLQRKNNDIIFIFPFCMCLCHIQGNIHVETSILV